jgi:hypothetical protein
MKHLPFLAVLVALGACSGEASTSKEIRNLSNSEIRMLLYRGGGRLGDTLVIESGETQIISTGTIDQGTEDPPECANGIDSAFARVVNGGTLTKKIQFESNWEVETEQTRTAPPEYDHKCSFTIRNSDIEL